MVRNPLLGHLLHQCCPSRKADVAVTDPRDAQHRHPGTQRLRCVRDGILICQLDCPGWPSQCGCDPPACDGARVFNVQGTVSCLRGSPSYPCRSENVRPTRPIRSYQGSSLTQTCDPQMYPPLPWENTYTTLDGSVCSPHNGGLGLGCIQILVEA